MPVPENFSDKITTRLKSAPNVETFYEFMISIEDDFTASLFSKYDFSETPTLEATDAAICGLMSACYYFSTEYISDRVMYYVNLTGIVNPLDYFTLSNLTLRNAYQNFCIKIFDENLHTLDRFCFSGNDLSEHALNYFSIDSDEANSFRVNGKEILHKFLEHYADDQKQLKKLLNLAAVKKFSERLFNITPDLREHYLKDLIKHNPAVITEILCEQGLPADQNEKSNEYIARMIKADNLVALDCMIKHDERFLTEDLNFYGILTLHRYYMEKLKENFHENKTASKLKHLIGQASRPRIFRVLPTIHEVSRESSPINCP